jgi:hypothetical protein
VTATKDHVGTVVLVDRKTRCVEVLGPELPGSRWPTDRQLLFKHRRQETLREFLAAPQPVGHCFQADGRRARFLVDKGSDGDALLDLLASPPRTPARLAKPYGVRGWLVEG